MTIPTPNLETKRLLLRELQLSDIESYQKYFNDFDVLQFLSANVPWPYPENGAEFYIKNMVIPNQGINRWDWGIFLRDNPNELIGSIGIFHPGIPENRGFWLGKKFWGKGLMTEAVEPVMNFAFNTLGLDKMVFANAVENNRSRRVKEKTNAKYVEVRPAKYVNPKFSLSEYWELSKENWQNENHN